jgi:hypothetical protein
MDNANPKLGIYTQLFLTIFEEKVRLQYSLTLEISSNHFTD